MWIRSQDRAKLIDANEIHIELWADERSYVISDNIVVASYSSEEKAMKVIDGIQNCLCKGTKSYHPVEPVSIMNRFPTYKIEREHVFKMPEDDEVEV